MKSEDIKSKDIKDIDFTKLKAGERLLLSGTLFTARDKAHIFLLENDFPKIRNAVIYHCGPIVKDNKVVAAGPTTSSRLNHLTPKLIKKYNIRAIIGKGGMSSSVLKALNGKAVYLSAVGGAGLVYAKKAIVKKVYKLEEFGMPEAIWELEVEDFPVVVAMDSKGNSLYEDVLRKSKNNFRKLFI